MNIIFVKRFMITCIVCVIGGCLIYFLRTNRNTQMATLKIIEAAGALAIVASIVFVIMLSKKKEEEQF